MAWTILASSDFQPVMTCSRCSSCWNWFRFSAQRHGSGGEVHALLLVDQFRPILVEHGGATFGGDGRGAIAVDHRDPLVDLGDLGAQFGRGLLRAGRMEGREAPQGRIGDVQRKTLNR